MASRKPTRHKKHSPSFRTWAVGRAFHLRDKLGLQEYELTVNWKDVNDGVAASMDTDPTYLRLGLTIYRDVKDKFRAKDYRDAYAILIHEFCHALTEPIYRIAVDSITNTSKPFLEETRERQTQRIARIILESSKRSEYMPTR